jgi:hypothetical protein
VTASRSSEELTLPSSITSSGFGSPSNICTWIPQAQTHCEMWAVPQSAKDAIICSEIYTLELRELHAISWDWHLQQTQTWRYLFICGSSETSFK